MVSTSPARSRTSFREGLSVLSTGNNCMVCLADTALRTADSGYLTRRLVDVAQDVIVREGRLWHPARRARPCCRGVGDKFVRHDFVETSVSGRVTATDITDADGNVAEAGTNLTEVLIDKIVEAGHEKIKVRSVLTCQTPTGVCASATASPCKLATWLISARQWALSQHSRLVSLVLS